MIKKATPPKKVIVNGRQFDSVTKAAYGLGVRRTEISKAIKLQKSTTVTLLRTPSRKTEPTNKVKVNSPKRGKHKEGLSKPKKPSKKDTQGGFKRKLKTKK